ERGDQREGSVGHERTLNRRADGPSNGRADAGAERPQRRPRPRPRPGPGAPPRARHMIARHGKREDRCDGERKDERAMSGPGREANEAERLIRAVLGRHGRLDVLVNNAGGQYFTPAELIAAKGWRAVWRLNVEGMLNMTETAFELALGPGGGGTVVNVTLSPHHGMPGMAHP